MTSCEHELDRPTARRCDGRRLYGGRAGADRQHRAAGVPRSDEPAWRRGACRHHGGRRPARPALPPRRSARCPISRRCCWSASTAAATARRSWRRTACFASTPSAPAEEKLADLFAGRSGVHLEERFSVGEWLTLKTGARRCSPPLWSRSTAAPSRSRRSRRTTSSSAPSKRSGSARRGPALVYHDRVYKPV